MSDEAVCATAVVGKLGGIGALADGQWFALLLSQAVEGERFRGHGVCHGYLPSTLQDQLIHLSTRADPSLHPVPELAQRRGFAAVINSSRSKNISCSSVRYEDVLVQRNLAPQCPS